MNQTTNSTETVLRDIKEVVADKTEKSSTNTSFEGVVDQKSEMEKSMFDIKSLKKESAANNSNQDDKVEIPKLTLKE